MARNKTQKIGSNLGFEADLFRTADKLRGNMEPSDYKHVVLGLIFLKYISGAFEAKYKGLLSEDPVAAEDKDEYLADNVFWVPKEARWSHLQANAKLHTIGTLIDDAMRAIEKDNESLKGVLPKDYARPALNKVMLGELIDLISGIALNDEGDRSKDVLGRVYEYFLGQFAGAEGKRGGEFYTPRSVVRVLVEMLEPYSGRVYDPCCGSGGMFVQSEKFVQEHGGRIGDTAAPVQRYPGGACGDGPGRHHGAAQGRDHSHHTPEFLLPQVRRARPQAARHAERLGDRTQGTGARGGCPRGMTPQATLIELLARVGAAKGAAVLVNEEELSQWPAAAVAAMKSQKLIAKARPAASAICPGCERECVMPVHTPPTARGGTASFIVCDKRSDINRVSVSASRLVQWRCNADAVCGFVAACLGLRRSEKGAVSPSLWHIGMATGGKRSQMLCLQTDGVLNVVAGNGAAPMADLICFDRDAYSLDGVRVRQLVDAAITADNRYTPSNAKRDARKQITLAMHKRWHIAIYGQESNYTTWRLAKMNLAVRGIDSDIRWNNEGSFHKDELRDLKADYILANPPFNDSDWGGEKITNDYRWKYGTPPASNANYAWIQHFASHLSPNGSAAFVLAIMALSSDNEPESKIRQGIVDDDLVEAIVTLPGKLFYTTPIPVSIWVISRNKNKGKFRDRKNKTLFIDASRLGRAENRTHSVLTEDDVLRIATTFRAWRSLSSESAYADQPGFCREVNLEEIKSNGYSLFPAAYIEAPLADNFDDAQEILLPFAETLRAEFAESKTRRSRIGELLSLPDWQHASPYSGELEEFKLSDLLELSEEVLGDRTEPEILTCTENAGLILQRERFSKRVATEDTSSYKAVYFTDIVYNPYLLWAGAIDQCTVVDFGITSPAYAIFKIKEGFDPFLIGRALKGAAMRHKFDGISIGTVQRRRRAPVEKFLDLDIFLPPQTEQQRFAEISRQIFSEGNGMRKTLRVIDSFYSALAARSCK